MRILFGVVLAHCHANSAGLVLAILQWLEALRSTGAEIWLIEEMASSELRYSPDAEVSINELAWKHFVEQHLKGERATLVIDGKTQDEAALRKFAREADLFVNFSGQWERMDWIMPCRRRVYLDVDPGFTQIWAEAYGSPMNFEGHTHFVTVGVNMNDPESMIPRAGHQWITAPPPASVALWDEWAAKASLTTEPEGGDWTTVTHWYGYNEIFWKEQRLGDKRASFLDLLELPTRTEKVTIRVASDIEPDWEDYPVFIKNGWEFVSTQIVCSRVENYIQFVRQSRGELGVAKKGYRTMRTGWMSDRSMGYLASGRPVLLQDTGWTNQFPESAGLRKFDDIESLLNVLAEVEADYAAQAAGARQLAETVFSGRTIMDKLLGQVGV